MDNLLRDAKYELDLSQEFYRHVRQAHRRVVERLEARDSAGARAEIARDLLEVDRYMAEAAGTAPFEPASLGLNLDARYVAEEPSGARARAALPMGAPLGELLSATLPPEQMQRAMVLKRIGSGGLYVVVPEEDGDK